VCHISTLCQSPSTPLPGKGFANNWCQPRWCYCPWFHCNHLESLKAQKCTVTTALSQLILPLCVDLSFSSMIPTLLPVKISSRISHGPLWLIISQEVSKSSVYLFYPQMFIFISWPWANHDWPEYYLADTRSQDGSGNLHMKSIYRRNTNFLRWEKKEKMC